MLLLLWPVLPWENCKPRARGLVTDEAAAPQIVQFTRADTGQEALAVPQWLAFPVIHLGCSR